MPGHVPCSEDDSHTLGHTQIALGRAYLASLGSPADKLLQIRWRKRCALVAAPEEEDEDEDEAEVFPVVLVSNLLLTLFDDVTTSCLSALWTRPLAFISASCLFPLLSSPEAAARCGPYLGVCLPLSSLSFPVCASYLHSQFSWNRFVYLTTTRPWPKLMRWPYSRCECVDEISDRDSAALLYTQYDYEHNRLLYVLHTSLLSHLCL